jgi:hypothetical protein
MATQRSPVLRIFFVLSENEIYLTNMRELLRTEDIFVLSEYGIYLTRMRDVRYFPEH